MISWILSISKKKKIRSNHGWMETINSPNRYVFAYSKARVTEFSLEFQEVDPRWKKSYFMRMPTRNTSNIVARYKLLLHWMSCVRMIRKLRLPDYSPEDLWTPGEESFVDAADPLYLQPFPPRNFKFIPTSASGAAF